VQPQGEIRDLPGGPGRRVPGARIALAQLRRHHLLDQVGLPVGRGLDRPQVPGLHPVLAERGHHPGDREGLRTVLPADPADQAVGLQLGKLLVFDARRLEQLAPGHVGRRPRGPVRVLSCCGRGGSRREALPDHPQRQVGVPLHGEDVAQPLDVGRREPTVARSRPGRLDQSLGLKEADLGRADVGKFRAQLGQNLTDTELAAPLQLAHEPYAPLPRGSAEVYLGSRFWLVRNSSRNLPIWTSSPPASCASSMRSRLT